jgi:hypothetical protein
MALQADGLSLSLRTVLQGMLRAQGPAASCWLAAVDGQADKCLLCLCPGQHTCCFFFSRASRCACAAAIFPMALSVPVCALGLLLEARTSTCHIAGHYTQHTGKQASGRGRQASRTKQAGTVDVCKALQAQGVVKAGVFPWQHSCAPCHQPHVSRVQRRCACCVYAKACNMVRRSTV